MTGRIFVFIFFLLLAGHSASALPVIDSVATRASPCRDNGSIHIYAHGSAQLSYAITAGPVLRSAQINAAFPALPPGSYTVQVSDASGSTTGTAIVSGSYQHFDFAPAAYYPRCLRDSDILLIGHPDSSHGLGPFSWQLTDPDLTVRQVQQSDTFHISQAGSYTIRCIDACGTVRQRYFTMARGGRIDLEFQYSGDSYRNSCDSMTVAAQFGIAAGLPDLGFPLRYIVYNMHGDTIRYDIPANPGYGIHTTVNGFFQFYRYFVYTQNNIGNVHPGDTVHFGFITACGDSVFDMVTVPGVQIFPVQWYGQLVDACHYSSLPSIPYNLPSPNKWILIDSYTHQTVDSSTTNAWNISQHPANRYYDFICFDECGDTLRQSFYWMPQPAYGTSIAITPGQVSCMDSTASVTFNLYNFRGPMLFKILSGPSYAHSTKPGFAYRSHISYPYILSYPYSSSVTLSAVPPGHYTYDISDSCGDHLSGGFDISQADVTDFTHHLTSGMNCPGGSSIQYQYSTSASPGYLNIFYSVRNLGTGQVIDSNYTYGNNGSATIRNLDAGTYVLRLQIIGSYLSLTDTARCSEVTDTVVVPPYTYPDMPALTYTPSCHGYATISAAMDSTLGVAPYSYLMTGGPLPPQQQYGDGTFSVSQVGLYTILGLDQCGNGLMRSVSVDSLVHTVAVVTRVTDSCFHAYVRGHVYMTSTLVYDTIRTRQQCDSLIVIDSVIIRGSRDPQPVVTDATDTFCTGTGGILSAAAGYHSYLWSTGETTADIIVTDSGWYRVLVTDTERCTIRDDIHIALTDSPRVVSGWVYMDSVCTDDPLVISPVLNNADVQYLWPDAHDATLERSISDSGTYMLIVSNQCASKEYVLYTTEKTCTEHLFIPNAFSPNGDGSNDLYQVYTSYELSSFEIMIYDRWGEKIYEGHDAMKGWDGRYRGSSMPAGIYVYEYEAKWPTGHGKKGRGSLTLLR